MVATVLEIEVEEDEMKDFIRMLERENIAEDIKTDIEKAEEKEKELMKDPLMIIFDIMDFLKYIFFTAIRHKGD
ncbi:MAG: hypothetical protein QW320_09755 [Ignisphaera sp.]